MHGKVRALRGGIKVLECLAHFPSNMQALCTFFRDFSHQGLFGSFSSFNTASAADEVAPGADRSNPASSIWYHRVDASPGMIHLSVYLLPEDVPHHSHDG